MNSVPRGRVGLAYDAFVAEKTAYQETLARGTHDFGNGHTHVLERIYVRDTAEEEIRWCYWKDGRFVPRPPDLPEEDLLRLFEAAVAEHVFTPRFKQQLKQIL